ncbi:hypothetical protein HYZ82_01005 [Candidatus Nomurabacteria bacterium]|nr:hypothetical protein [Candidatus Nomurabacteria bacterium]
MKLKALKETTLPSGEIIAEGQIVDISTKGIMEYFPFLRQQTLMVLEIGAEEWEEVACLLWGGFSHDNVSANPEIIFAQENFVKTKAEIEKLKKEIKRLRAEIKKQPLHRQPRGYLKTTASLVGKDTSAQKSLFEIPHFDTAINPYKKVLTKMTAITGNLLFALWQANKDDNNIFKITNLSEIARQLRVEPKELKLYLIYLGGYQRPITKLNIIKEQGKKDKRILSIYHDKLFYIKFNIRLKDGEKGSDFNNDARVGTNYLNFIKDRDIESVEVMPSLTLQEELAGSGLGNVLVDDSFVAFSLGLSDLAYKLFCFSGSNKPTFKITFSKLIDKKYLNLEQQVKGTYNKAGKRIKKGKGQAKILERIKDALAELKDKGHLKEWDYNEQTDLFSWTFSNAVFKHKLLLKKPDETGQTDQTGQDKIG